MCPYGRLSPPADPRRPLPNVQDITSRSLSLEHCGGDEACSPELKRARVVIPRFSKLPAEGKWTLTTIADDQTSAFVAVREGEEPLAKDNQLLGDFDLEGIQRAPRGVPNLEVTFNIDDSGILRVSAQDQATGASDKLTVANVFGFTSMSVEAMSAMHSEVKGRIAEKPEEVVAEPVVVA
jgi:molecular chaperone DnaK (HSP70)